MNNEFPHYPKIRNLGHEDIAEIFTNPEDDIFIEEKMDGANFRFATIGGKIIFGSRSCTLGCEDDNIGGNWKRCIEFIKKCVEGKKLPEGFIFYGEDMVKHSMDYDWTKMPPYLGFDIRDLKNVDKNGEGGFIPWEIKTKMFHQMGLPTVPFVKVVKAKEITEMKDELVPIGAYPSPSLKNQKAEGLMLKNYNKQLFGKFVRSEFKEINAEAFGGTPKYAENDNGKLMATYCTNPRIEKIIFKLIDEGHKLDMPMMKELPVRVYKDIWEEQWEKLVFKDYSVNFREMRKIGTKRCLAVLKQIIQNNILNNISGDK